jgi:hypothetical protein
MKKISKHLIAFAILALLVSPVIASKALAQTTDINTTFGITDVNTALGGSLGAQGTDPRVIITQILNIALGFLGIIAVGIILFGGFKWMTAAGNEDKVEEAKKVLSAGVIGLLIVLCSWALATYAIGALYNSARPV